MTKGYVGGYLRRGQFIVETFHRSHGGPWIAGPVDVAGERISDRELGERVMASLEKSTVTLQTPQAVTTQPTPAMIAVGAQSWAAFARGAVMVGIALEDNILVLEPMQPGERNSFVPHAELAEQELEALDAEQVGRGVRELLETIRDSSG